MNPQLEIADAIYQVYRRIEQAARRSGRNPDEIKLVAVSKGVSLEAIEAAARAGITQFGENRVQEAIDKFGGVRLVGGGAGYQPTKSTLHLIGSLQTNKVKKAVGFFDLIHSIDSIPLAMKVSEEAQGRSFIQAVLVQVNIGEEATKRGVSIKEAPFLVEAVRKLPHLSLLGLMAIAPQTVDPEGARPFFSKLRVLGDSMGINRFSMGMSNDFEVAIEEGATWVRIGTALFGARTVG